MNADYLSPEDQGFVERFVPQHPSLADREKVVFIPMSPVLVKLNGVFDMRDLMLLVEIMDELPSNK